nr:uncharacterized protein LOC112020852 isoform X2 [Quercus suber]
MSSDQSSVREGAGYDEVFGSGSSSESESSSWSSERETSAHVAVEEMESQGNGGQEEEVGEKSEVELGGNSDGDEGVEESSEGDSVGPEGSRPFILPKDWAVNKFSPKMTLKIFNELRTRFQIPDHIPIRLPMEGEKCYTGRTADVGMYDAMFAAGLRLPLTALHRQLADHLGISISQIAPNSWRIFISAEVLWGRLSGGHRQLTLDEFFYCYRPRHLSSSRGMYHFAVREKDLRLVSEMPDSNRAWKSRFFFVEGTDWVCRQDEWETIPHGCFDNTWGFVKESGFSRHPLSPSVIYIFIFEKILTQPSFFSAFARPSITDEQEDFIRRLLEIPIGERSCRDLITLDTLYTYCGGPEPTPEARRLEDFARHQMDAAKERIKAAAARQREEKKAKGEATSTSVPRAVAKGSQKRKTDGVVIRPPKRQTVTPVKSPPTSGHGAGKGVMTSSGPILQGPQSLLMHKDFAVEAIQALIKPTDMDPCDQLGTEELGSSALFDLSRALVRVKALQDRCVAKEGVVTRVNSHNATMRNQQAQYKEAVRTLNVELKDVRAELEEAKRQRLEIEEKLTVLHGQLETVGAEAVEKFKASDAFIDSCGSYYGTGFDDCLKQVASAFPDLDLSGINIDDARPTTPATDAVTPGVDDSVDSPPPENSGVVLAQPAANLPTAAATPPMVLLDEEEPVAK